MVIVAELVKRLIVVQEIVGSSPIFHTKYLREGTGIHIDLKRRVLRVQIPSEYKWSYSLIGKTYRYER